MRAVTWSDYGKTRKQNQYGFALLQGQFIDLDTLFPETQLAPMGINDLGQIVGAYSDASGTPHGLLLAGGTITAIDYPGAIRGQYSSTWN